MKNEKYNDVYVRSNLSGDGTTPEQGAWTQSPDIIPNGTEVMEDPVKNLTDNYDKDLGQATVMNQQNYFYLRGKNLHNGPRSAKFELYYCPQNLFLFPSLWRDNQLETSSGEKQVEASAAALDDILVPVNAFTNVPKSSEHHCLIGRVITDEHPNPLPNDGDVVDMDALCEFILDHPGFCWRNVVLVNKETPTFTHYFDFDNGDESGEILMGLNCKNITIDSSVAFSCGDPIPSGPDKGKVIELTKTAVKQSDVFLGQMTLSVPANFKTKVSYSYWAKTPILGDWKVEFTAILLIRPGHKLYDRAKPVTQLGFQAIRDENGDIVRGIQIGECSTQGK